MLTRAARPSAFVKFLTPDPLVPSIEASESAEPELIHRARKSEGSFTWVAPEQRPDFELKWVSPQALSDLGLPENAAEDPEFAEVLSGAKVIVNHQQQIYPWAQNYGGYQFGSWAGQLGDGRAVTLFSLNGYDVQLKGSGLTPYSRFADGKAVLRSSIREALVSEYLNKLRIPTTRCLSLVSLPSTLARREKIEACAVIARMAPSFVRIGSFDLHHSRGDRSELRRLADFCIDELRLGQSPNHSDQGNRYFNMFRDTSLRNARMMAKCQAYGFLNGVLNTDNISVLGLSMDYGPFAFMDTFDSSFTPNHDDFTQRYSFRNSPTVVWWNCVKLGEALGELIGAGDRVDDAKFIEKGISKEDEQATADYAIKLIMGTGREFQRVYEQDYQELMLRRIGILNSSEEGDVKLIEDLLFMMQECEIDYNTFFRKLADTRDGSAFVPAERSRAQMVPDAEVAEMVGQWMKKYADRVARDPVSAEERREKMNAVNPNLVLRNSVLSDVIESAQKNDWSRFDAVAEMVMDPFSESWPNVSNDLADTYLGEAPLDERDTTCSCSS